MGTKEKVVVGAERDTQLRVLISRFCRLRFQQQITIFSESHSLLEAEKDSVYILVVV